VHFDTANSVKIIKFTSLSFSLYESCQTCQKLDINQDLHILVKSRGSFMEQTLASV
jgi:hypothetical protein